MKKSTLYQIQYNQFKAVDCWMTRHMVILGFLWRWCISQSMKLIFIHLQLMRNHTQDYNSGGIYLNRLWCYVPTLCSRNTIIHKVCPVTALTTSKIWIIYLNRPFCKSQYISQRVVNQLWWFYKIFSIISNKIIRTLGMINQLIHASISYECTIYRCFPMYSPALHAGVSMGKAIYQENKMPYNFLVSVVFPYTRIIVTNSWRYRRAEWIIRCGINVFTLIRRFC